MKRVLIITKRHHTEASEKGAKLAEWLAGRDSTALFAVPEDPGTLDLAVVLGGDGTILWVAREVGVHGVPILGANMGGLGFLTAVGLDRLYEVLERWLAGESGVQERMTLSAGVLRHGTEVSREIVLNDLVINKGALARIMDLKASIDGRDLTTFRGDGLIVSTPTGSTAYNLAAGGPIVSPTVKAIIVTPICPFTLTNRPLVLEHGVAVEIEIERAEDAFLTYDGQVGFELKSGDVVKVHRADKPILLVDSPLGYFEILRTKLKWG